MQIAISQERLVELLRSQLKHNFLLEDQEAVLLETGITPSLQRAELCFRHNKNKYYQRNGEVYFNPYHSAQYCIFLYFLGNTLWKSAGASLICDKIYFLNKMLNGIDLFYEVAMPDIFFTDHPVGTVMGRAKYGSHFTFNQNCTVGNNKGIYPVIGNNVRMCAGSRILGKCQIGDDVVIASGAFVKDQDIPACSLVFGTSPHLVLKSRSPEYFQR